MTHDNDVPKPGWVITPEDEKLDYKPPKPNGIEEEILKVARRYPGKGRLFILDVLNTNGHEVSEAVVNFVLACHHLDNLHKGS